MLLNIAKFGKKFVYLWENADMEFLNRILNYDCLEGLSMLPNGCVDCCVTSPPYYGLRDYGHDGQIGLEETPEKYVDRLVEVFRGVRRVLKDDGTVWLNLGDSYAGSGKGSNSDGTIHPSCLAGKQGTHKGTIEGIKKPQKAKEINLKPKDLIGIPWMVAFALRADGWYLRQDIIWHKPNPMPESVTDRCTKAHEYIFLLSKSQRYWYDADAIKERSTTFEGRPSGIERNRLYQYDSKQNNNPQAYLKNINGNKDGNGVTRTTAGLNLKTQEEKTSEYSNKRSVWTVTTKPFADAHFATFPEDLIVPCIKAGCQEKGVVLDPFMGAGTTALVARKLTRNFVGFELNADYVRIAERRIREEMMQISIFDIL